MEFEGRVLGLDVGDVRIGVAVSDPMGIIAQPLTVIARTAPEKDIEAIAAIATERETRTIVVGLPLNQHGQPGPQAEKTLLFVEALRHAVAGEIVTVDERFTTAFAQRALVQADVSRKGRKKVIDKLAAQQILQTYLDRRARLRKEAQE